MNELEQMVFDSHVERLQKSLERIRALESAMQEFCDNVDEWVKDDLKYGEVSWRGNCCDAKDKFKQLLENKND